MCAYTGGQQDYHGGDGYSATDTADFFEEGGPSETFTGESSTVKQEGDKLAALMQTDSWTIGGREVSATGHSQRERERERPEKGGRVQIILLPKGP